MRKMKQGMAVALTAAMVLGSAVTALAADPAGSGSTTGTGTSEGHVDKEIVNMVLPTIESSSTPFAYTMDPERLIQETGGAKYEDYTFPAEASDTGVYFLTGDKTYANESTTLQAVNKSNCNVTLTVKVKATQSSAKDITLVNAASSSTTAAELYLGLKVGTATQAVSATEATVTKTVAGMPSNFETKYVDKEGGGKEYAYQEKEDASSWKAINISMTGSVNNHAIAADTTAPTVEVTWEYDKAADDATVDTDDTVDYTTTPSTSSVPSTVAVPASGDITIPVTIGSDNAELTKLETSAYAGDMLTMGGGYGATYADGTITLGSDVSAFILGASADDLSGMTFTATFGTGDDAYTTQFTFTK